MLANDLLHYAYDFFCAYKTEVFVITILFIIIACSIKKKTNKRKNSSKHYFSSKDSFSIYKGAKGEANVGYRLSQLGRKYTVLNDVMLETDKGTSQIDHIVVSKYGIHVIETKNYKGLLVGDDAESYFKYYCGKKEYSVYSPIKQNRSHIFALMKALEITDKTVFIPVLTLANNCRFDILTDIDVVSFKNLCKTIKQRKIKKLNKKEVKMIVKTIKKLNITDKKERAKHVERVQSLKEATAQH